MARVLVTESYISDIASAIRSKNGQSASYTPSQMASAIGSIISAGALSIISKSIILNGTYSAEGDNADAFSSVVVDVPNTYTAGDEGKVVVSGALSAQGVMSAVSNSVYDTTMFSQVVVDVAGGGDSGIDPIAITGSTGSFYDNTLLSIRSCAFISHSGITGVEMTQLKGVPIMAFESCSNLVDVKFPECLIVSDYAFRNCTKLQTGSLPKCSYIGINAFLNCISITDIFIPNITSLGIGAFRGCGIKEFINSQITILNGAFSSCVKLSTVSLAECSEVGSYAFSGCAVLSSVSLPKCEIVKGSAFAYCRILQTLSLPMCKSIDVRAFYFCDKLESLYLLSTTVCSLVGGTAVFGNTPLSNSNYLGHYGSIFVPSDLVDTYKASQYWSQYSDRITAYVEE